MSKEFEFAVLPKINKTYIKPPFQHSHLPEVNPADAPPTPLMEVLHKALTMRRAGGSETEAEFVAWFANQVQPTMIDEAGNLWIDMRHGPQDRLMVTAHTDSVHHKGGVNTVLNDGDVWRAGEGHCLGADDGAGLALMAHMIAAGVPALYAAFRLEETGGVGSRWAAKHMTHYLKDIDHCVSLDRAGTGDVITHQGMGRCCSDEFALALADQLTTDDLSLAFSPDDGGVFTDSANFTDIIPECTNLSVFYFRQHGDEEHLDVVKLQQLADQLVKVDWVSLPTSRDPAAAEDDKWGAWDTGNKWDNKWSAKWDTAVNSAMPKTIPVFPTGDEDYDEFDIDEELELDELTGALIEAYEGKFTHLIEVITAHVGVNDTACVASTFNTRQLDVDAIDEYLSRLDQGWTAQQVAEAIYDENYLV